MSRGALSIKTTVPKRGPPRYADLATDDGFLYHIQGSDPNSWNNQQLLLCAEMQAPMVYFCGIAPSWYRPIFPVFVSPTLNQKAFLVVTSSEALQEPGTFVADPAMRIIERKYSTIEAKKRLHQDAFRYHVLSAYRERCTVCRLPRRELLDAAHIIPDRDPRGLPTIQNGLALCKLHHSVYDTHLLAIRPDLRVEISAKLLEEHDGPTLQHALKGYDGSRLHLPANRTRYPDVKLLEERYEQYLKVG